MTRLDAEAVARLHGQSPSWEFDPDRGGLMTRDFVFNGFADAFAFMTHVALAAERLDHHPESSNVYNLVRIVLTTHDVRGLSTRDVTLSALIERFCASVSPLREAA